MQELEGESRDREAGGNDDIFGANSWSKDDKAGRSVQQEHAQPSLATTTSRC
jgi:hypothetical protein